MRGSPWPGAADGCNAAWPEPDPAPSPRGTCREPSSSCSHFLPPSRAFLGGNAERLSHRRGGEARGRSAAHAPRRAAISSPGHLAEAPAGGVATLAPRWPQISAGIGRGCLGSPARSIGRPISGAGFCPTSVFNRLSEPVAPEKSSWEARCAKSCRLSSVFRVPRDSQAHTTAYLPGRPSPA